ncbi:MAG: M23 family metallopeptidase, partial [Methanosarcinales archaeon]|nr:M23 family metallopeptidase [Methanosarcinales archaeon]
MTRSMKRWMLAAVIAATLMIASVGMGAAVEVPVSDGFDYPVGNRDNFDGWHTSLFLGGSWCDASHCYYGHLGEDYLINSGSSKDELVYSASNGVVYKIYTGSPNSWGGVVIIKHVPPPGSNFSIAGTTLPETGEVSINIVYTLYAHIDLSEIYVHENENVGRRTPIGKIGVVPNFPTPHLHFEIKNQTAIDTGWQSGVGHGYSGTDNFAPNHYKPSNFNTINRPKITPLIGDWDNNNIDDTGTFNPRTSTFSWVTSPMGEPGDLPIVGDWNRDGRDTIGVYRPRTAEFFLDDDNDGVPDQPPINFGEIGDFPIVGDWNGDGNDNIGVFRSLDPDTLKTTFFLKYSDGSVVPIEFGTPTDIPLIGDWDNDGKDDIGVFRRNDPDYEYNAVFYLRNIAEPISFGNNDDTPIVGKPDIDGLTRVGVYRPSEEEPFIFRPEPITDNGNPPNIPPEQPITLGQWDSVGATLIPFGGITDENTVLFDGVVSDPDNDDVQLEVEIRPLGVAFTDIPTCTSD